MKSGWSGSLTRLRPWRAGELAVILTKMKGFQRLVCANLFRRHTCTEVTKDGRITTSTLVQRWWTQLQVMLMRQWLSTRHGEIRFHFLCTQMASHTGIQDKQYKVSLENVSPLEVVLMDRSDGGFQLELD
ncbi:unnamed protein product [Cylicocyclus nassatus]|uniref:Uncharacterized protein n=1 Tax=Cylicocyclus nassatus TaxID=53992 RepID=A0AA36DNU8_CYLNA|nr:unnamed protein product [Cylicocyclus nassatus]